MKVIFSIIVIMLMIVVHEWGHFIAGRICKVPVYEFSIGFGPKLFQHKGKKETLFSIRAIPLGGYCAFDEEDATGNMDTNLNKQPLLHRLFIFAAGPFMNIFTCLVLLFICGLLVGTLKPVPVVDAVDADSPAYTILQKGDEITKVNGVSINMDSDVLTEQVNKAGNTEITIEINRDDELIENKVTPEYDEEQDKYTIGFYPETIREPLPLTQCIKTAFIGTKEFAVSVFSALKGLITGKYSINEMSSIVGIVDVMSDYATIEDIIMYINLCAFISCNLGIMNLLPIPGLDGSKILFGIVEGISGKKLSETAEMRLTMLFMSLLLILSGYLMLHDIGNIFR